MENETEEVVMGAAREAEGNKEDPGREGERDKKREGGWTEGGREKGGRKLTALVRDK